MNQTIFDLVRELSSANVHVRVVDGQLEMRAAKGKISQSLVEKVRDQKEALVVFLSGNQASDQLAILPQEKRQYYVTSASQKRMYFLHKLDPAGTAYNLSTFIFLDADAAFVNVEVACAGLIARHESLRTVFAIVNDELVQKILPATDFELIEHRFDQLSDLHREENRFVQQFDLLHGLPFHFDYFVIGANLKFLVLQIHHSIYDDVSEDILRKDFFRLYNNENLVHPFIAYRDYAVLESSKKWIDKVLAKQKDFWMSRAMNWPVIELPLDFDRPLLQNFTGRNVAIKLDKSEVNNIRKICKRYDLTLFVGLLGAFQVFIAKITGHVDIVIGSPVSNRDIKDNNDTIGLFVNTIPFRSIVDGNLTLASFFESIKNEFLVTFENRHFPFNDLVKLVLSERNAAHNPLFDIMFNLKHEEIALNDVVGSKDKSLAHSQTGAKVDLTFTAIENGNDVYFEFEYADGLFLPETIDRFISLFRNLLTQLSADPLLTISSISIIPEREKQTLLQFNDTQRGFNDKSTLLDLFYEQVTSGKDKVALSFEEHQISFGYADILSTKLANYLITQYDPGCGDLIGIVTKRSEWMILSILAVIKANCAYVPIDPSYSYERIDYIKQDGGIKICIDDLELDHFRNVEAGITDLKPPSRINENSIAYVIYTSGSTGNPKGCMLAHKGLVNRIAWMWRDLEFSHNDIVLQKTTFTFDVSVWEIFLPLCLGCRMVIATEDFIYDPPELTKVIVRDCITTLHFVPSVFNIFVDFLHEGKTDSSCLSSLRAVVASGEALLAKYVNKWYSILSVPVYNLYGPTEASVDVSWFKTSAGLQTIPIGGPIDNTELYILDAFGNLLPVGIPGELYIGGVGVGRGYLNNPVLTHDRFIKNPYRSGEYMYRSGDRGRWLSDGTIEFLGRVDDQVKIRGYRVEPGEVQSCLLGYGGVRDGVVVALREEGEGGSYYLCAYYVSEEEIESVDLRSYLSSRLPEYMVPHVYMRIGEIPLTVNGKVNRRELPRPDVVKGVDYEGPANDTERRLVMLWSDLLGINSEELSVLSNFFEMGGHSLRATVLVSRIHKEFGVKMPLKEVFGRPDVRSMAYFIQAMCYSDLQTDQMEREEFVI